MMNKQWWQNEWLKTTAVFTLLALLFFGRALFPAEGQVLGGYDMRGYYYILHDTVREAVTNGRLPLWDPYRYAGYPFLADPQQNSFYPFAWLTILLPTNVGVSWYMAVHVWLAGVGMVAFVRYMGGRWLPGMLAGIAFAFSGLLTGRLWAGHSTVYALDSWTPWLLLALLWSVRQKRWTTAVLAGVPMGMALLAGHIPSFLYVAIIWGAFALYLFLFPPEPSTRGGVVRQAAIMLGVGLALAAVQIVPFGQFSLASERVATADYQFATDYSLPPAHLITLLFPEFFGEPTVVGYWSVPTFEELTYYAGLLVVLGVVLALRRPTRLTWFYLLLMIVGLALALGRYAPFYRLAYDWLPPFRVVRAPGRAAFLYLFGSTALLGHALSHWLGMDWRERPLRLKTTWRWALTIAGLAGFLAIAATGAVFMSIHPTDTSGRLWQQIGGYAWGTAVLLIGGGLLWAYLSTDPARRARLSWLTVGLLVVATADMWFYAQKMVRLEPARTDAVWYDARALIGDTTARVLPWGVSVFAQNGSLYTDLHSVFGYASLEPEAVIHLASSVPDPRSSAYDLLGVQYVFAPVPLDQFTEGEAGLRLLGQQGAAWVYERPSALPVARLVTQYELIANADEGIQRIHQPDFDLATTAILTERPSCALPPSPIEDVGTVEVITAVAGEWRLQTRTSAPALLLLAETAYPGWQATIDGQQVEWQTAYTAVRAVCVPAGEHEVVWQYRPTIYWLGGGISLLALLLVVGAALWWRSKK